MKGILLLSAVGAIFLSSELSREAPPLAAAVPRAAISVPRTTPIPPRPALRLSGGYAVEWIEARLGRDRLRLAACLLQNPALRAPRIRLTLLWSGTGALIGIQTSPPVGPLVEGCFESLFRAWKVPPHPGLQPFTFKTLLVLS